MSPNEQLNVFDAIAHVPGPAYAGLIDHAIPEPVGSGSESVTAFAVPAPEFPTVIVKPMFSPAFTAPASAVLSIVSAGQLTVVEADACTEPVFVADAVASFGYVAQLANDVALVMCTDADAPGAMSPNEQCNVPDVIAHDPGPAYAGLIDQLTPAPAGSGSDNVAAVAEPAPVFETVIVKPIESPALTESASAVLVMFRPGHWTVVVALACTTRLFVAWADAVFV
jgi:hypothetical protein